MFGGGCQKQIADGRDDGGKLLYLVGLRADVGLRVFETRDGAVAEAAHHRHQRVEVLQLQQLLSTRKEEVLRSEGGMRRRRKECASRCQKGF